MKNQKKIEYQSNTIKLLEKQIEELKQECFALEEENNSLKRINEINKKLIEELEKDHIDIVKEYRGGLDEIKSLKRKYEKTIKSILKERKEYNDKMRDLLKKMRKENF